MPPKSTSHCVSSKFTLGINKYFISNSLPQLAKVHALLSSDGDVLTLYVFSLCIEKGVKRSYRLDFLYPCLSKYSVNTMDRTHKQFQLDIPILVLRREINLHQEYKNDNIIPVSLKLTCIFVKPNDIYMTMNMYIVD